MFLTLLGFIRVEGEVAGQHFLPFCYTSSDGRCPFSISPTIYTGSNGSIHCSIKQSSIAGVACFPSSLKFMIILPNIAAPSGDELFRVFLTPQIHDESEDRVPTGADTNNAFLQKKYLGFISLLRILPIKWGKLFSLFNDRHSKFFKMKWPSFVFLSLFLLSDIISLSHSSSFP